MTIPIRIISENAAEIPARELIREISNSDELRRCMRKLTAEEMAVHLGVSLKTVSNWAKDLIIPSIVIRGVVRFDLMDVEDVIKDKHTVKARN